MKSIQTKANELAKKMESYTYLGYDKFRITATYDSVYMEGLKNGEWHPLHRLYKTRNPQTLDGQRLLKNELDFYTYELAAHEQQGL